MLPKAFMRDAQREIIKSCFPATQSPPHFLKEPEEKRSRSLVNNVMFGERSTMQINVTFFEKAESNLCFYFCLMLILTLTLRHLERRTLLLIPNFRTYCGSVKTKHLPFVKTDKI